MGNRLSPPHPSGPEMVVENYGTRERSMGITAILATAMKQISWGQVADIAVKYGPDFIRKLKDRLQQLPAGEHEEAGMATAQLSERISELEGVLIKQEELIEQQNKSIALLEEIGKTLQARLNICMALAVLSGLLSAALGLIMFLR